MGGLTSKVWWPIVPPVPASGSNPKLSSGTNGAPGGAPPFCTGPAASSAAQLIVSTQPPSTAVARIFNPHRVKAPVRLGLSTPGRMPFGDTAGCKPALRPRAIARRPRRATVCGATSCSGGQRRDAWEKIQPELARLSAAAGLRHSRRPRKPAWTASFSSSSGIPAFAPATGPVGAAAVRGRRSFGPRWPAAGPGPARCAPSSRPWSH
jgi:hypothetical protein